MYIIYAMHSRQVIDLSGSNKADCTPIIQYTPNGGENQNWIVIKNADNSITLKNEAGQKVMDVEGGQFKNGTRVISYTQHDGANQHWNLEMVSQGRPF